jgi:hypothetical protein
MLSPPTHDHVEKSTAPHRLGAYPWELREQI